MASKAIITKSAVREATDAFTKTSRSSKWGKWLQSEFGVTVSKARLDLLFTAIGAKGAAKTKTAFLDRAVPVVIELLQEVGVTVVDDASDDESRPAPGAKPEPASVLTHGGSNLLARGRVMKDVYAQLKKDDLEVEEADGTKAMWSTLTNGRKLGVVSTMVSGMPEIAVLRRRASEEKKHKIAEIAEIAALLQANGIDMSKLRISIQ